MNRLCKCFDHVYRVECWDHQNSIILCHDGEFVDSGSWESWIGAVLQSEVAKTICPDFDLEYALDRFAYIGGLQDDGHLGLLS